MDARKGRSEGGPARPGPLRPGRRPAGERGRALGLPARDRAEDPRSARPAGAARLGARRIRPARARRGRSPRRRRSSRGSKPNPPRRDRHARAPGRRCARGARACAGSRRDPGDRRRDDARRAHAAPSHARTKRTACTRASACIRTRPRNPATSRSCASCSPIRRRSRSERPGSTTTATTRRARHRRRSSNGSSRSQSELGKPVVIHSRAADDDTRVRLLDARRPRHPALLLVPGPARCRAGAALVRLVRGQRHLQERLRACAPPRAVCRPIGCSPRPTARTSPPQPVRGKRNEPAYVTHTYDLLAELHGEGDPRADRRERRRGLRAVRVTPKKSLGQHFLVDENILGVIERLAELDRDDVVLEVGPGLGVLTRFLAERVSHVHAVELDKRLAPELAGIEHTTLHWGDALRLDVARARARRRGKSSRTCRTTSRRRSSPRASTVEQLD